MEYVFQSESYWYKVVEFLQQNWAVIEPVPGSHHCVVHFFDDGSRVFDQLRFLSEADAIAALQYNGFQRFGSDDFSRDLLAKPKPPFQAGPHINGRIYSSGRFWKNPPQPTARKASKRERATVIVPSESAILLTLATSGLWLLPGGRIERGELPIAAAARELHEETGLVASALSFLFQHESATTTHHVFLAQAEGTPMAADDALSVVYYASPQDLGRYALSQGTEDVIKRYRQLL